MSQPRKTDGVVVTITSRDRLPDVQRILESRYANPDIRTLSVDLLAWCATEIRYLRLLTKGLREQTEEAS